MVRDMTVAVLLVLLAIVLFFNPLYFYPDGGADSSVTYTIGQITTKEEAVQALSLSSDVLDCPGERPCALESEIIENGTRTYDERVQRGQSYAIVRHDGNLYRPTNRVQMDHTVLSVDQTTPMRAVEYAAVSVENSSKDVRRAIKMGEVTVTGTGVEALEQGRIIETGGEYYYTDRKEVRGHWTDTWKLPAVRIGLVALGLVCIATAVWHVKNENRSV
jgi:hypothetical protein